jgi:hypothetical protein
MFEQEEAAPFWTFKTPPGLSIGSMRKDRIPLLPDTEMEQKCARFSNAALST